MLSAKQNGAFGVMIKSQTPSARANQYALNGNAAEVRRLLDDDNVFVNKVLISCAVESGSTDILQMLLHRGWDINMPESFDEPPFLGMAVRVQDEKLVRWFLENGADPSRPCQLSDTPLSRAAQYASLEIIQLLLAKDGASATKGYRMNFACLRDDQDTNILKLLFKHGAAVDKRLYEDHSEPGWTEMRGTAPLISACVAQKSSVVEFLLQHGADPLQTAVCGYTPLSVAEMTGRKDIIDMLLKYSRR